MIYIKRDSVNEPKAIVIISHGIGEHLGRYDGLAESLNRANYNVVRYDLRGHGHSCGESGKIDTFHTFIDDLHEIVIKEKESNLKIFLLGHSMGGEIVHLYQCKYGDIDGIISSGASTDTPTAARILRFTGFWWLRWFSVSNSFGSNDLTHDKKLEQEYVKDPLRSKRFYGSLLGEMFISGIRYLKKNMDKITIPIIYLHGKADKIVDYRFSEYMYNNIPSKDREIILYDDCYHEIYHESIKDKIITDTIMWLDKHV